VGTIERCNKVWNVPIRQSDAGRAPLRRAMMEHLTPECLDGLGTRHFALMSAVSSVICGALLYFMG
jgi:hypothetical protein